VSADAAWCGQCYAQPFLLASVTIYVLSAVDACRIGGGGAPIVGPRALLWGSVGLIVLSILIATFVTLPAVRR
jgi:hypothetical protein